jgi:hypothetical protein
MGFLRTIFALDRLLRRVPSIIEIWFLEFLALLALGLGLGAWSDAFGLGRCPPAASGFDWNSAAFVGFGLVFAFFAVRRILKPTVKLVEWTPVHTVKGVLPVPIPVPQTSGRVEYHVLSSHPSYGFVHVLTLPIPLIGVIAMFDGLCTTSYFHHFGVITLILIAALIILRIVSWYGLKLGRERLAPPPGMSAAALEWQLAWQPVVAMLLLMAACFAVPAAIIGIRVWLGYGI